MSETLKLRKALSEHSKFIDSLFGSPARNTELFDHDLPHKPPVDVEPAEALNCFLRKNPSYERFRKELSEVRDPEMKYSFVEELWNKLREE